MEQRVDLIEDFGGLDLTVDEPPHIQLVPDTLSVAMIGLRGIPARYGGVETVVQALSGALVDKGHDVTVYCWKYADEPAPSTFGAVKLRHLSTWGESALGSFCHAVRSTIDASRRDYDVIHYHALGPGIASLLGRLICRRSRIVVTVHGRDDQRAKWGPMVRSVLRFGVWVSAHVPHETVVVSRDLARDYSENLRRETVVAPNAITPIPFKGPGRILAELGLDAQDYAVSVGRLVPEKAVHRLITTFGEYLPTKKLVLVGGGANNEYVAELHDLAAGYENVIMAGRRYGDELAELVHSAAMFVTGSDLEGLPTALLEAVMADLPVVASDIAPHAEVLESDDLGHHLIPAADSARFAAAVKETFGDLVEARRSAAALSPRVRRRYCMQRAVDAHEQAYGLYA